MYKLIENFIQEQPEPDLALWILIFLEAKSMKNIGHFLKTVMSWSVQKKCLEYKQKV